MMIVHMDIATVVDELLMKEEPPRQVMLMMRDPWTFLLDRVLMTCQPVSAPELFALPAKDTSLGLQSRRGDARLGNP